MDIEIKKLKKMTRFMQKQKILSLKTREIEIQLSPDAFSGNFEEIQLPETETKEAVNHPLFTEEDTLLWSSPGVL